MTELNMELVDQLSKDIKDSVRHKTAIALDFDGVCKLFTLSLRVQNKVIWKRQRNWPGNSKRILKEGKREAAHLLL